MDRHTSGINLNFSLSPLFKKACELAKVPPTTRQAAKFRHKRGQAFQHRIAAWKELGGKERLHFA